MGGKNFQKFKIPSGTREYSKVTGRFLSEAGNRNIVQLERIQNKLLYQQYSAKKKHFDSVMPFVSEIERELWHGTIESVVENIVVGGFNRRYCGRNATKYGQGVYFAVNAYLADGYAEPDEEGDKRMFLCKVLTGEFKKGNSKCNFPPTKDSAPHIEYESLVDNEANPTMFVSFHDTHSYPCYLITYQ